MTTVTRKLTIPRMREYTAQDLGSSLDYLEPLRCDEIEVECEVMADGTERFVKDGKIFVFPGEENTRVFPLGPLDTLETTEEFLG